MRLKLMMVLACVGSMSPAIAADWTLDPTFTDGTSGAGRATIAFDQGTPNTDYAVKVLRQSSGKYVVVGSVSLAGGITTGIGIARYLPTGALDPTFAGTGSRVKDACFITVRNATLDSLDRIVVVGEIATLCTGNTTTDAGVVRFTADGADDVTFAGDGGIGFKFNPLNDGSDWAGAVVALADNSLVIGGSLLSSGVRQAVLQSVSATGVVSNIPSQGFVVASSEWADVVDGIVSPNGTTTWLAQRLTDNATIAGVVKRVFNGALSVDPSFGVDGEQLLHLLPSPGYVKCPGLHYPTSLVRVGLTLKVFGYATVSKQIDRSWFSSVRETNGGTYAFGCLALAGEPVSFFAQSSVAANDAAGTVYLSGRCGAFITNLCLWRTVYRTALDVDTMAVDTSFNGGNPVNALFPSNTTPGAGGSGISVMRDGNKTVVTGTRRWSGDDLDFATARFGDGASGGDPIFANGFE